MEGSQERGYGGCTGAQGVPTGGGTRSQGSTTAAPKGSGNQPGASRKRQKCPVHATVRASQRPSSQCFTNALLDEAFLGQGTGQWSLCHHHTRLSLPGQESWQPLEDFQSSQLERGQASRSREVARAAMRPLSCEAGAALPSQDSPPRCQPSPHGGPESWALKEPFVPAAERIPLTYGCLTANLTQQTSASVYNQARAHTLIEHT